MELQPSNSEAIPHSSTNPSISPLLSASSQSLSSVPQTGMAIMGEEKKFVDDQQNNHFFAYPLVLIYRYHDLLFGYQNIPTYDKIRPHNVHQIVPPGRNYAFTQDANDQVKLGRMDIETVGLSNTEDFYPEYFDMELVSSPHFLISRSDFESSSSVWIQDLDSRTGTFLNGKKLKSKSKVRVYDGDVVSIGISHLDPVCDLSCIKHFVFKIVVKPTKYSLKEIDLHNGVAVVDKTSYSAHPAATDEAVFAVLNNIMLVSQIIDHLDLRDMKSCRLINKVWDEEISKKMGRKAVIHFNPPKSNKLKSISLSSLENWKADFKFQIEVMKILKIENIKIGLQSSRRGGTRTNEVTKDICWFMDNFGPSIKCFNFKMELINSRDVGVFLDIFKRLRFLEEIELDLRIYMNCNKIKLPAPLETVRSVRIIKARDSILSYHPCFIPKLLNVFPSVETVGLLGNDELAKLTLLNHDAMFLLFRNLKSFSLNLCFDTGLAITFLQKLETYPRLGLESLSIGALRLIPPVLRALRGALKRHAPTLKSLNLTGYHGNFGNFDSTITFPHFPNLKKLKVDFEGNYIFRLMPDAIPTSVTLKFPSGKVNYNVDFPSLEELHVALTIVGSPPSVRFVETFFEAFVPLLTSANQCNRVMKKIHFDFPTTWYLDKSYRNKLWGYRFFKSFESMFPNAILSPKYYFDRLAEQIFESDRLADNLNFKEDIFDMKF